MRFVERTLILIDIENLLGKGVVSSSSSHRLAENLREAIGDADAQTIVACNRFNGANVVFDWPASRVLLGRGPNAADIRLVEVIENEKVALRFGHVIIGSGDAIFAGPAARLVEAGVAVTALVGRGGLSRRLRLACQRVVHIERSQAGFQPMLSVS